MSALSAPIEVFFSYADADEPLCKELEKHLSLLSHEGLIITWHKRKVIAGTDWKKALDRHLNTASIILLLISADFVASDYCYGIEVKLAMERHEAGEAYVLPIWLRPVDWQGAPFGKLQALPSNGVPITKWLNRDEAFTNVVQDIRTALQEVPHFAASTPRTSFSRIWKIPYSRNPLFTGRKEILNSIWTQLQTGQAIAISQTQAINGLGGVGKTQTALEYAYRYCNDYQVILWAKADSWELLLSEFTNIVDLLHLPLSEDDKKNQILIIQVVKDWLETHNQWLLILDNLENLELIREFIPPIHQGHILLTTRIQATIPIIQTVPIEKMEEEEGALLLLRRAGILAFHVSFSQVPETEGQIAKDISHMVDGLPLALDQAGAFIAETASGLSRYRDLYERQHRQLLARRGRFGSDHPESVSATLSISFQKVEKVNAIALELLRLCAFFHPDAIPDTLITAAAKKLGPFLGTIVHELLIEEAFATLLNYSLIHRDKESQTVSMHRLVQMMVLDELSEEEQQQRAILVVKATDEVFPHIPHEYPWGLGMEPICEPLLPHVKRCIAWIEHWKMDFPEACNLSDEVHQYIGWGMEYSFQVNRRPNLENAQLLEHYVEKLKAFWGIFHVRLASSLGQVGQAYWEGRYPIKAVQYLMYAIHIVKYALEGGDVPSQFLDATKADPTFDLTPLREGYPKLHAALEEVLQFHISVHRKKSGKADENIMKLKQILKEIRQHNYIQAEILYLQHLENFGSKMRLSDRRDKRSRL